MALDVSQLLPPAQPEDTSTNAPPGDTDADAQSGAKTVDEVEAFWRNRVSRKDLGHAAAERTLRDEIETLKRVQAQTQASGSAAGQQGADGDVARLQKELADERSGRVIDQRKAKYPALVAQGVSDAIFSTADDASLAKLNALADDNADGGYIAPTAPRRAAPVSEKPLHELSKAELLDRLKVASVSYEASLRE